MNIKHLILPMCKPKKITDILCGPFTFVVLFVLMVFGQQSNVFGYSVEAFNDVPEGHWAYESVMTLRELGITDGVEYNNFGTGQVINALEFETFLNRLTGYETSGEYTDIPVTRGEMTEMIIKALGYERIALNMHDAKIPFTDAAGYHGYVAVAHDLGITAIGEDGLFRPYDNATRGEAAVILAKLYRIMNNGISFINGFYAIRSSSQTELIDDLDCVSFGWSRIEPDSLNMTSAGGNEYAVPEGYMNAYGYARSRGKKIMLMVTVQDIRLESDVPLIEHVLSDEERGKYIGLISGALANNAYSLAFDGVVIDFENLKGDLVKMQLNAFLSELRDAIGDKEIHVAVHPARKPGEDYFDAYDYRFIGEIADKLILMAHDYNAKNITETEMATGFTVTPLAPIREVYYALRAITDKDTGVADRSKVMLQISFDTAQWKLQEGKIINSTPYRPEYETLVKRMDRGVHMNYSINNESPYIEFYNTDDSTDNIVWYEDARSTEAKIKLAKLFGIEGLSVWRLGNVPNYNDPSLMLNVWDVITGADVQIGKVN